MTQSSRQRPGSNARRQANHPPANVFKLFNSKEKPSQVPVVRFTGAQHVVKTAWSPGLLVEARDMRYKRRDVRQRSARRIAIQEYFIFYPNARSSPAITKNFRSGKRGKGRYMRRMASRLPKSTAWAARTYGPFGFGPHLDYLRKKIQAAAGENWRRAGNDVPVLQQWLGKVFRRNRKLVRGKILAELRLAGNFKELRKRDGRSVKPKRGLNNRFNLTGGLLWRCRLTPCTGGGTPTFHALVIHRLGPVHWRHYAQLLTWVERSSAARRRIRRALGVSDDQVGASSFEGRQSDPRRWMGGRSLLQSGFLPSDL